MKLSATKSIPQRKISSSDKKKGTLGLAEKKSAHDDSDDEVDEGDVDQSVHYASLELKKILHFNEGIEKMNELAAQLHQEFVDDTNMRPGAASAFYDQLVSIENAHKYPTYLSHTPDSMFETKHIKFESPFLNPGEAGLVCRDPSPEEYAKYLAASGEGEFNTGPSSSSIDRQTPSAPTTSSRTKRAGKIRTERSSKVNDSEDEMQSVLNTPEIWKLLPDNSYSTRQNNMKDILVSETGEPQENPTRMARSYYPSRSAFTDTTLAQAFWVHLGIPMPLPSSPDHFLTNTFLKHNSPNPHSLGLIVSSDGGVRRFTLPMHGFSGDELTFTVEGKRIAVTGTKPKDKRKPQGLNRRSITEGFTLPGDLHLQDLQVHRDDMGNVIFEEIWREPVASEEYLSVLDEDN